MFADGFLGRGALLGADLNLLVQVAISVLLLAGMGLARRGAHRAHGLCQTSAFIVTLALTVAWMIPSLRDIYAPGLVRGVVNRVNVAVAAHVVLGGGVLLLGAWVVLVAGTPVVPARLRFQNYKRWMRTLLSLWWAEIALGALTYFWATS
jgi:uncharacterized membrane protein YozB (DUF420 family)